MDKHQRLTPLIRLLACLGWQRDPDVWTVHCHDGHGRRAHVRVHLTEVGVTLMPSTEGPVVLNPLEAGRLRAAVRDALFSFDALAGSLAGSSDQPRTARPRRPTLPRAEAAAPPPRQRVSLTPRPRPSVAEIAARIEGTPLAPTSEVDHDHHEDKARETGSDSGQAA